MEGLPGSGSGVATIHVRPWPLQTDKAELKLGLDLHDIYIPPHVHV
jgi:hypothetical protein